MNFLTADYPTGSSGSFGRMGLITGFRRDDTSVVDLRSSLGLPPKRNPRAGENSAYPRYRIPAIATAQNTKMSALDVARSRTAPRIRENAAPRQQIP